MSRIINGKVVHDNDMTKKAMGGTELMRTRIIDNVDKSLLKGVTIHFSRIYDLDKNSINILYLHDLPDDFRYDKLLDVNVVNSYDFFVFVTYHQRDIFLRKFRIPIEKTTVIKNAIGDYFYPNSLKKEETPIKLIYHTTPHRGLELLLPIFLELQKHHNVELDVYSSFKIYGWENDDRNYSKLFDELKKNESIRVHGTVKNDKIVSALRESDMFIYPCVWHETSCLALMEAIQNGCICVHPDFGALPETAKDMTYMFGMSSQYNDIANRAYNLSKYILDNYSFIRKDIEAKSSRFVPYSIVEFKDKWHSILKELKHE